MAIRYKKEFGVVREMYDESGKVWCFLRKGRGRQRMGRSGGD